jgi:hypothetical protein
MAEKPKQPAIPAVPNDVSPSLQVAESNCAVYLVTATLTRLHLQHFAYRGHEIAHGRADVVRDRRDGRLFWFLCHQSLTSDLLCANTTE